ncbi:MAG: hypothetical protein GEV10_17180 [Streptosporangiales bacterium]|nr:hypothetical protein [Streptosporangiales bacterium]
MAVGAYCTYVAEPGLDEAVARLRADAVAATADGVHRPGDGTAEQVTEQACRVTEGTLLARHLLERAVDEPRPESADLLALTLAALGRPGTTLPAPLTGVDGATAAIPVCDTADAYVQEAVFLTVDLDRTDVAALNTLHLRPPSAIRYRLAEAARLDWVVRDATRDEWTVSVDAGEVPDLPDGAGYVLHRTDPATGAFAMEPAPSYDDAVRLAAQFAEHGFPGATDQMHGFGNPYPEVVTVSAVRYREGGVDVLAAGIAEARREFVSTPEARYVASLVGGERREPERTGWMLFGLTDLPAA